MEKSGVAIYRCGRCGVRFWTPENPEAIGGIYGEDYFKSDASEIGYNDYFLLEKGLRKTFRKRLRRMKRADPNIETCIEVGSGPGFFLHEAATCGLKCRGVEISEYASGWGRENLGVLLDTGKVEDVDLPLHCFDAACMWDVIEHLPDPVATLKHLRNLLKPNGRIWLSTGDSGSLAARISGKRWHLYTIPEHLFFFDRKSIRETLKLAGFETRAVFYETIYVPLAYVFERLAKTLNLRIPLIKNCAFLLPITLFDVMTVYAQKSA